MPSSALRSGVSINAVRYYDRRRLLPVAPRTEGGFRLFTPEIEERVQFIKQAQEPGHSLDEIGDLLATGGARECRRVRDHLKVKLSEVGDRIRLMQNFRKTLARHLAACRSLSSGSNGRRRMMPRYSPIGGNAARLMSPSLMLYRRIGTSGQTDLIGSRRRGFERLEVEPELSLSFANILSTQKTRDFERIHV